MENIPKTFVTLIQTIMFPLWSLKHRKNIIWSLVSIHLGGSFDYVFTHMAYYLNFEKKIKIIIIAK
jgi:hypothetical protein